MVITRTEISPGASSIVATSSNPPIALARGTTSSGPASLPSHLVQAGVTSEGTQALFRGESKEQLSKLDVLWRGNRFDVDPQAPPACRRQTLESLPTRSRDATLITGHRRLRGAGTLREGALGKSGGEAKLAHEVAEILHPHDT
jgi:hypothetical protein